MIQARGAAFIFALGMASAFLIVPGHAQPGPADAAAVPAAAQDAVRAYFEDKLADA